MKFTKNYRLRRFCLFLCLTTFVSTVCSCGGSQKSVDKLPEIPATMQDSAEHLMIEPLGDVEGLLGRPVIALPDGGFQIADARVPSARLHEKINQAV